MSNNLKERFESALKNSREENQAQLENKFNPIRFENGKVGMALSEKQERLLSDFRAKKAAMMQQGKTVVPTMAQEHGFSK